MDIELELYHGAEPVYFGEYQLAPVLRKAAVRHFGDRARQGKIELLLEEPLAAEPYPGPPEIRNLGPTYGHCSVRLIVGGKTVLEDRLRIVDLFGPVLTDELRELLPDEQHWAIRLRRRATVLVIINELVRQLLGDERPTPEVQGAVDVDPRTSQHRPFIVTPIEVVKAEVVEPEDLGLDPERLGRLNILMSGRIHDELLRTMPLSSRVEEGGFLLGRVSQASTGAHLIEVTHVTPAQSSGAGAVHFTFTGDSFLAAAQLIEERDQGEDLLGWYHTHLLGVGTVMGLSTIDVDLHLATFHRPWQVAALINLRYDDRLLRFYGRNGEGLREYDQWISDDSGRYRPASHALGSE